MNVLEGIECDSSAESDVSEAEYDFNKASDDAIHSEDCRSSHESDISVASSSSSSTSRSASLESVSKQLVFINILWGFIAQCAESTNPI